MSSPTTSNERPAAGKRSTSLGFLRRPKSNEPLRERKASGSRLGRKKSSKANLSQDELQRQQEAHEAAKKPPRLPGYTVQPQIQSFGGENYQPKMAKYSMDHSSINGTPPVPSMPEGYSSPPIDPYARTESMTHRGRYSYASSAVSTVNSPRRVRRRKDPTPYNILIIGAKNSGKTSFLNFLKTSTALSPKKQPIRDADTETPPPSAKASRNYIHHYQEAEVDNERIGLTIWDSQGLEKGVVDLQLREMSNFVESKFEDTFLEEQKVVRAPGVRDTHIHLVFFILDPSRLDANIQAVSSSSTKGQGRFSKPPRIVGGLDEDFDLQVLRTLQGKTTIVPVISKADTVTTAHMAFLKKTVWESLKQAGLDPLEALALDPDGDSNDDIDKLDEQDEDDEAEKTRIKEETGSSEDEPTSPKTEDSDTLPQDQKPSMKRLGSHKRQPATSMLDSGFVPLSILSPDPYSANSGEQPIGRRFPWGFADPYNPEHCDFVKLKDACFGDWRADLREASREVFYEHWRTSRLNRKNQSVNGSGLGSPEPRKSSGGIPIQLANTGNRYRQR